MAITPRNLKGGKKDHYLGGIIEEEIIEPNKVENGAKLKSKGYSEFLKDHFMPLY